MNELSIRRERARHANELIRIISAHGRRFFYSPEHNRIAHIEVDDRSRVWFIDDYSGKRIYTHATGFASRWHGFTHGGTLRSLIEAMRDYVVGGWPIGRWRIAIPMIGNSSENIWGYDAESAALVRTQAFALPIIESEKAKVAA